MSAESMIVQNDFTQTMSLSIEPRFACMQIRLEALQFAGAVYSTLLYSISCNYATYSNVVHHVGGEFRSRFCHHTTCELGCIDEDKDIHTHLDHMLKRKQRIFLRLTIYVRSN